MALRVFYSIFSPSSSPLLSISTSLRMPFLFCRLRMHTRLPPRARALPPHALPVRCTHIYVHAFTASPLPAAKHLFHRRYTHTCRVLCTRTAFTAPRRTRATAPPYAKRLSSPYLPISLQPPSLLPLPSVSHGVAILLSHPSLPHLGCPQPSHGVCETCVISLSSVRASGQRPCVDTTCVGTGGIVTCEYFLTKFWTFKGKMSMQQENSMAKRHG